MIAKPFSPGNAFAAEEVARERHHVRQGDDRLVHQRQLRRSAVGGVGAAWRRATAADEGGEGVRRLPRLGRRRAADRAAGPAAGWRIDCRRVPRGRRRDPPVWCGPCFGQGPDALTAGSARSPRSIATGRTGWDLAAKATSRRRGGRGLGAGRLHGAAERARTRLGRGEVWKSASAFLVSPHWQVRMDPSAGRMEGHSHEVLPSRFVGLA